ncbi:MAG: hypothetical protein ACI92Z_001636 [Paracoccaceae bacterium]|jgi:hypothetical protein
MKKMAILAVVLGFAGCDDVNPILQVNESAWETVWANGGEAKIMSRTWKISRKAENLNSVRAERDNNNLNIFGGPAVPKIVQATQAIEQGTGCKIVKGTLYKNDSDVFYADVLCKYRTGS